MFCDEEMDEVVSAWTVLAKEKHVQYLQQAAAETSREDWMKLTLEAEDGSMEWRSGRRNMRAGHLRFGIATFITT
jgi:hypothetical protein